ncbi:MAG: hypothetical protein ABW321_28680 [Polyangiales bacterium]
MRAVPRWLALLVFGLGCDDNESPNAGPGDDESPLYAVSSNSYSAGFTGETSQLWLVDELSDRTLAPEDATELAGGATLWGIPGSGFLYVISGEDLSLTKYELEGGELKEVDRLGLSSQGISTLIGENLVFDGPKRAFLFELQSAQALIIDLEAMQITGSIDLSDTAVDERSVLAGPGFRKHGDHWVNTVYGTSATYDRVAQESKLLVLDPKAGTVAVKDAPCGGLGFSVAAPNGDLYFASDPFVGAVHSLDESAAPAPCLARLPHDSDELDAETVALNDVTGGVTGGVVGGPDGSAFLRVLDEAAYSPEEGAGAIELYTAAAWQTWRIELADPSNASQVERALQTGNIKVFEVNDLTYENESTADLVNTRLVPTSKDASEAAALEMPGVTWGVVRLR